MKTWLPIRKEYLIDNFESLLSFLTEADYNNMEDGFLRETIDRLEETAEDMLHRNFSHRLGIEDHLTDEWIRNLKIVCASIYASFRYGRDITRMMAALVDTLMINRMYDDLDSLDRVKYITVCLAQGRPIPALPFNLSDLIDENFNVSFFAKRIIGIAFDAARQEVLTFGGKGECVFEGDKINVIPELPSNINRDRLKILFNLAPGIDLQFSVRKRLSDMDFKEAAAFLNIILQELKQNVPPAPPELKNYDEGDKFFVEVTRVQPGFNKVFCRTLDPEYNSLELQLYIPYTYRLNQVMDLSRQSFLDGLKEGNRIQVRLTEKEGERYFSINDSIDEYYYDLEDTDVNQAIFLWNYSAGTTWLTEMGKVVNIMSNPADMEIQEAAAENCGKAIEIRYGYAATNRQGQRVLNASRVGEIFNDVDHNEFKKEVADFIVGDFVEYWELKCPAYTHIYIEEKKPLEDIYVRLVCHLLGSRGDINGLEHLERYMDVVGAKALAIMLGADEDEAYCEFTLVYLRSLWAFAQDPGHEWTKGETIPYVLETSKEVKNKYQVMKILAGYNEGRNYQIPDIDNEININRLGRLVEASNALLGNISTTEINRIKRYITQCLGIGSIYKEEASEKHWFGDESEKLEFKSSIVFPPSGKAGVASAANPNMQIWAILKTINGFLNSLHGGTLLVGVNDFGNACGIESDMEWLYQNGMVLSDSVDRFIQYVKLRVDNAFEAYKKNERLREITNGRIGYTSFSADGCTVLRIDVNAYETGCVRLLPEITLPTHSVISRPDSIKEAYIRSAVVTEELSERMRKKVEAEKKSVIKDSEKQSFITVQEGIDTQKIICLNGYESGSGISDRKIIPVELLPQRGLLVGIESGKKDLKVYKLSRCESVTLLDETFKPKNHAYSVDPFNMLSTDGRKTFKVELKLKRIAALLIKEMYPYSENYLKEEKDVEYPYRFSCMISDVMGIGSFCLSVLGSFKIEEGRVLEEFIREKCGDFPSQP